MEDNKNPEKKNSLLKGIKKGIEENKEVLRKHEEEVIKKFNLSPDDGFIKGFKAGWNSKTKEQKRAELAMLFMTTVLVIACCLVASGVFS